MHLATKGDKIIQNIREVASYSWTDAKRPTIVVPGFPPIWTEQQVSLDLPPIPTGRPHLMRKHPLLPVIAAASHTLGGEGNQQFSLKKLDLVTDQVILSRLASWAAGITNRFSYDVLRAGNTVMISRRKAELKALSKLAKIHNKRFQFAMVSQEERLISFHRIISYSLGGLRLLVQCETNACLLDDDGRHEAAALEWKKNHRQMIGKASVLTVPKVRVIAAGIAITQGRTMHFQARSEGDKVLSRNEWFIAVMHMTLSQTHHHVLGVYDQSALQSISRATLGDLCDQHDYAALGCDRRLLMLKDLLPELCATIRKQPDGKPMRLLCKDGTLTLQTRKAKTKPNMSPRVLEMFR